MDMEPLFAVRMTHDEDMYYNQVLASKQSAPTEKPGKKNFLSRVDLSDVIFGLLAFFVFYMTFPAEELAQRIVQWKRLAFTGALPASSKPFWRKNARRSL